MPLRLSLLLITFACLGTFARAYTVYVSNERAATVSVIDGASRTVRATWPVGNRPRGIHLTPEGTRLFVAVSGSPIMGPGAHADRATADSPDKEADGIAMIDTATGKLLRKLSVGSDPEQFALTRAGRQIIVSNEDEATVSCWDVSSGRKVYAAKVSGEPEGVAIQSDKNQAYITCEEQGDVFVIDSGTGSQVASVRVTGRPRSVAFSSDGARAYVPAEGAASVSVIDTRAYRVEQTIQIPGADVLPMCAITAPDGKAVYVSTGRGNSIAMIDPNMNTVMAVVSVGQRPWGIALSPDGSLLFTANGRSNDVSVVDVAERKEVARIKVGQGPWGIAVSH